MARKDSTFGKMDLQEIMDWGINISLNTIDGVEGEFKFGRATAVGTSQEVIWDGGGEYVFLDVDSPEQLNIVSDDVNDTNGGSGAWNIAIFGLDNDFNPISELIVLNGLTPVTTQESYLRVFRMVVIHSGSVTTVDGNNTGTITATAPVAAVPQAIILPMNGQTLMCVYTVPAGFTGLVTGISVNTPQSKSALFRAKIRNCFGPNCAFTTKYTLDIYQTTFFGTLQNPFNVPEKSDIVFTAQASIATTSIGASWGMILIKNDRIQGPDA